MDIFKQKLNKKKISHFLYIEDDINLTEDNIKYWLNGRKKLKKYGLIPSFLRYEINAKNNEKYSVDVLKKLWFHNLPKIKISKKYYFLNLPQPYQGLYLLDRILLKEHLNGLSSHPDNVKHLWNIRERAAQGVTFSNVPSKFNSRNLVGYDSLNKKIDSDCLVYHLPNNYIKKNDIFSRIKIKDLIKKLF